MDIGELGPAYKPWEYSVRILEAYGHDFDVQYQALLNAAGEHGWELVSVVTDPDRTGKLLAFLKRPDLL